MEWRIYRETLYHHLVSPALLNRKSILLPCYSIQHVNILTPDHFALHHSHMCSHWVPVKHHTADCDATPGVTLSVTLTGDRGRGRELTRALPVPHWAPAHGSLVTGDHSVWVSDTLWASPGSCHQKRGAAAVIPFVTTSLTQFWSLEMNVAVNCVKEWLLFARVVCSQPPASGHNASPRPLQPGLW